MVGEIMFFGLCSSPYVLKTQSFGNWMFLSSGKMMGAPTLLDPLQRGNLNHRTGIIQPVCLCTYVHVQNHVTLTGSTHVPRIIISSMPG
jgi:hypothetical protein